MHCCGVARWDGHGHGCTILIWRRLRNCLLFGMLLFSHYFFCEHDLIDMISKLGLPAQAAVT